MKIITSTDDLKKSPFDHVALDFETEDIDTRGSLFADPENDGRRMVMFSIAFYNKRTLYSGAFRPDKFAEYWDLIKDKVLIFHNAKFDLQVLILLGVDIHTLKFEDTMVMSHLIDELRRKALKELRVTVLRKPPRSKYRDINTSDDDEFTEYARADAEDTIELYKKFVSEIEEQQLENVYELEKQVIFPTIEMEQTGIEIDTDLLLYQQDRLMNIIDKLNNEITKIAGGIEVNINSQPHMNWFLFEHLGYDGNWITPGKSGFRPTNEGILSEIAKHKHTPSGKAAIIVLELRTYRKLLSTYSNSILEKLENGRIHSQFNPVGTVTGRFSSRAVNLQNIPAMPFGYVMNNGKAVLDEKNKPTYDKKTHIRSLFIASKGKSFIISDYSQVELRVMGELSQDPIMCGAYREGADIHQITADSLGISRSDAKAVNFGIGYGLQSTGLMAQINAGRKLGNYLTSQQAQEYIDNFWVTYSNIAALFRETDERMRKYNYVRTISGRKRRFYELRPSDFREAHNTIIQGSAADLMKLAMIHIYKHMDHTKARFVAQVHDEVLLEVDNDYIEEGLKIVQDNMERCMSFSVPIIAEPKVVTVWSDAK